MNERNRFNLRSLPQNAAKASHLEARGKMLGSFWEISLASPWLFFGEHVLQPASNLINFLEPGKEKFNIDKTLDKFLKI